MSHLNVPGREWRLALALCLAAALVFCALADGAAGQDNRSWKRLADDGVHDPKSGALQFLQEPADALSKLPQSNAGDRVDWDQAISRGTVVPRSNIYPGTQFNLRDTDILLDRDGSMPLVRFPHRQHTYWLDCSNCHDALFKKQAGANRYSMMAILEGEQCGVCHGAVAFPLTECRRCHSVQRSSPAAAGKR